MSDDQWFMREALEYQMRQLNEIRTINTQLENKVQYLTNELEFITHMNRIAVRAVEGLSEEVARLEAKSSLLEATLNLINKGSTE